MDKTDEVGRGGDSGRRYAAELLGTALLVFAGVGSAIFARQSGGIIVVGLSFGLVMLVLAYALAPASGAHLNPAVTLGVLLSGKLTPVRAIGYWIAQVLGAVLAGAVLWGLVNWGRVLDETGALGTNSYGTHINAGGAAVVEFILTFLFVLVVVLVANRYEQRVVRAVAVGLALGLANLVAIPLDGASINPARSIGPAVFQGGVALSQLWLFIVVPLLGGAVAAAVAPLFARGHADRTEDDRHEAPPVRDRDWRAKDRRADVAGAEARRTGATREEATRAEVRAKKPTRP